MTYMEATDLVVRWRHERAVENALPVCWDWLGTIGLRDTTSYTDVVESPELCIGFATHLLALKVLGELK